MSGVEPVAKPYTVEKTSMDERLGVSFILEDTRIVPKDIFIDAPGKFQGVGVKEGMKVMAVNASPCWGWSVEEVEAAINTCNGEVTLWIYDSHKAGYNAGDCLGDCVCVVCDCVVS